MISPLNRDGLAITQPGRLEELYYGAPVNEPLDTGIMPTNVQQGIAPLYNDMVNPNFYENMYSAPPMNLDQKKEAFANNLKTKKQNQGLKSLMTNAMSLLPTGQVIRGLAAINPFLQNTDFAQATSLADYLDMRKYGGQEGRETARRMNQREVNEIQGRIDRKLQQGGYDTSQDRGRGQNIPSAPKETRNTYSAPQQSGGSGGLHSK